MEMSGVQVIAASQQRVWEALNDPEVLRRCIPGCQSVEKIADGRFTMVMAAAIGPVKARFEGKLAITESDPPDRYVLSFDGSGGAAGFGKGNASVSLSPVAAGTHLTYAATAQIGGKIAQVGSRLVDGVARKMAEEFFARFNADVAPRAAEQVPVTANQATPVSGAGKAAPDGATSMRRIWIAVVAAALAILAWYLVGR